MSGPARVLPIDVWPVVLERLVSVGKRGMRPVTVIVLRGGPPDGGPGLDPDRVASMARDSDTVGLVAEGGLAVVCPDTAQTGGIDLANRLIAEAGGAAGGLSAGVATVPVSAMTAEDLLAAAMAAAAGPVGTVQAAAPLD